MTLDAGTLPDEALLDRIQRAAFEYFLREVNPANGLVADRTPRGAPASIAVVGFALSSYAVAAERGWLTRADAATRSVQTLRFFWNSSQHDGPGATGYQGFFYHFLDLETGRRVWQSELSLIDTTLLIAGALTVGSYFNATTAEEIEIRWLSEALYRRVNWQWARGGEATVRQGWKPECGFLHYGWDGYSEATILYVLGLGSPTFPLPADSYDAWTATYQWENLYSQDFLYAGPLFIHQFSHAWIDFAGIRDRFMREKGCDYFENSRRATYVQREYARRNPHEFAGYGENGWGLTAGDGPGYRTLTIAGRTRRFFGYAARGVPYGPDDGTLSPGAVLASLPFAPEIVLQALRHLLERYPAAVDADAMNGGINPTLAGDRAEAWASTGLFGLDQGIVVLMIENHRSRLIWRTMRRCPHVRSGLLRAGFTGGWLRRRAGKAQEGRDAGS